VPTVRVVAGRGVLRRRTFLKLGAASAVTASLDGPRVALGRPGSPFIHGVASGDPMPDRVILWTRVTPTGDATPGSGLGPPTAVRWEAAGDESFRDVVARGEMVTSAATDHTVKVDATGLPADTGLWYRFHALGATSPVGRTRTAPRADAELQSWRIGVVSCSNWQRGYFGAYRHLADRDDIDLVVHLGDYLYEYGVERPGAGEYVIPGIGGYLDELGLTRSSDDPGALRDHDPEVESIVLEHYRRRHAQYKTDPDAQRLHARHPMVATIDDHETTDNSWAGGAENHQPDEGDWAERRAQAMQAYFEWMPIRVTGGTDEPQRVYRRLRFGGLVDLLLLDERTYRSKQPQGVSGSLLVTDPAVADPARTMLGSSQRRWLDEHLAASDAHWKVLGNPVMFAPLVIGDPPEAGDSTPALQTAVAGMGLAPPVVVNGDQWDGYRIEQRSVGERLDAAGSVVLLTGDIHSSWAAEIPADAGSYLTGLDDRSVAVEFVVPAVSSDSLVALIASSGMPAPVARELLAALVDSLGPWFAYRDLERNGFGILDVTTERAQFEWWHVEDRTDPESGAVRGPSWSSPAGTNRLAAAGPLGPRPNGGAGSGPLETEPRPGTVGPGEPSGRLPATGRPAPGAVAAAATAAGLAAGALTRRAQRPPD
jgi:alkaline phosphatase D